MNRRITAALLGLAVAAFACTSVEAARPAVPAALYPAGAHISFRAHVTNHQLDCLWSFFCDGRLALFHTQTQDQLGRTGGWAEFAGAHLDGGRMVFALFASTYAPGWSKRAYEDLTVAIENQGYTPAAGLSTHLSIADGESMAELQPNGSFDLVVMAAWTGDHEIEGLVDFAHNARARHDALRFLRRQMKVALSTTSTALAQDGAPTGATQSTMTQAQPVTTHQIVPFNTTIPGCTEPVAFTGTVLLQATGVMTASGGFNIEIHSNPQGVVGTGLLSGIVYRGTGASQIVFATPSLGTFVQTVINNINFVAPGATANSLLVHATFHVTANPDGTVTAFIDNVSVTCAG
jgi:hypothetical protein